MAAKTIGQYLIEQLHRHGVGHVFGIPGDYSLAFIKLMEGGPVRFINTCDEQGAGFAADVYGQLNGLGAACVTYAVGSLKIANATGQAFAERSPMVVICGSPGIRERREHPLLHHRVNEFDTQIKVFQQLTVASTVLADPETAFAEIDRVIHAAEREKRPVYIELPRDRVESPGRPGHKHVDEPQVSDDAALAEALAEAKSMIVAACQPVILAGDDILRFGLQKQLVRFAEATRIPVAVTFQGKSLLRDDWPLLLGMYAGAIGPAETCRYVESADCHLMLGAMMTDFNVGFFSAHLDRNKLVQANVDAVEIRHHRYDVRMGHFIDGLLAAGIAPKAAPRIKRPAGPGPFVAEAGRPVTVKRLFQRVAEFVTEDMLVLADTGDALFGATELPIRKEGRLICSAYYGNMGFAVPGAVGAQILDRSLRPLVLVGDGAFQMTGMELSTAARYGLSPIVVVLNNSGYATERFFIDGEFNEIQPWRFSRVPEILAGGPGPRGFDVHTEDQLETALQAAAANTAAFSVLDVHLARGDVSEALRRLGEYLGRSTRG